MDNKENLDILLREYGYPDEAINRFLSETSEMDYEEAKKLIMPYRDITADRRPDSRDLFEGQE
ncbi:hypothetical protein [Mesobacillus foraminis]|uniref:Uncharacterized protein n=1 Tax=Mesobacillus foraminis TaxID=279826 RepID=A0A4R2BKM8_9BACI|nr:hypothetical protein [Mesobacillus foraminis]TCN27203.1 hypothetical protein EV146_102149 [Mesobacillus foraminis]